MRLCIRLNFSRHQFLHLVDAVAGLKINSALAYTEAARSYIIRRASGRRPSVLNLCSLLPYPVVIGIVVEGDCA